MRNKKCTRLISLSVCIILFCLVSVILSTNDTSKLENVDSKSKKLQAKIAPSILNADMSRLADETRRLLDWGADYVHLDIMDGMFVPNITFGHGLVRSLRKNLPNAFFDAHIMVQYPDRWITSMAEAGVQLLTFHVEASPDVKETCEKIREHGMQVGLAIKPKTAVATVVPYMDLVDMILVMTVEPGLGGQQFMSDMLPKVRWLRSNYPTLDIQVDGGVGPNTISECAQAGANVIVSGTAIVGAKDPKSVIVTLRAAVEDVIVETFTIPPDVQRKMEAIKDPKVAKVVARILAKKGEKVEKLVSSVDEQFSVNADKKLKERKDLDERVRTEYKKEFSRRMGEKLDLFKQVAVAEHYDEVKPFFEFICAFRLIENTLQDARQKGVDKAGLLMVLMQKTEVKTKGEVSPHNLISPPHLQFYKESLAYAVPGEEPHNVDSDYDNWRRYLMYKLGDLAMRVRQELESIRGERTMQDVIAEFSFVAAKLAPYSYFIRDTVVPQARSRAINDEEANRTTIFLDVLPTLMPTERWYFPTQYLDHFNVLRRAMNTTQLKFHQYYRDGNQSVIPASDACLDDPAFDDVYEYVDLYFSTEAPELPHFGMMWYD